MSSSICGKEPLQEHTIVPGIFEEMDSFELSDSEKFALSVRFQFPKFSKGFTPSDFESFIDDHIGINNVVSLGRLCYPNEWQMQVNSKEIREKLIRLGRTRINARTCWISPLSQSEVRGFVHWIPTAIQNSFIEETLTSFGEVVFIENTKQEKWKKIDSDSRYFALNLKPGQIVDDIPHFVKICDHTGLITIKGRNACCFHCREVGHRKSECKKFREKLSDYNSRKPNGINKRIKPRGQRHRPSKVASLLAASAETPQGAKPKNPENQTTSKSKKKRNKANKNKGKNNKTEAANKIEETTNVNTNKNNVTVNVAKPAEVAKNSNISEESVSSLSKSLDLIKLQDLLSSDDLVKKRLAILEDLTFLLNGQGSSLRNDLNIFWKKWYPEEAVAKCAVSPTSTFKATVKTAVDSAGLSVSSDVSAVDVSVKNVHSDVGVVQKENPAIGCEKKEIPDIIHDQNENPAPVSEGMKKKKKKKKNKNK